MIQKINEYTFNKFLIEKYKLPNGLQVIVMEDHSAPVFAYHTWFHVGSRNEKKGTTGIAHLFEHLMFKQTKNTQEGEFDRILEEQGGKINAATYVDWTFYRESVPKEAFDFIPKLEADRMENMILSQEQLTAERDVVMNERRLRVDNSPQGAMYEVLYSTAFKDHPYHWPVIGWMEDIEAISRENCIDFYKTYYAPNNATVIVVGDVETKDVLKKIEAAYGNIPSSTIPETKLPVEPKQTEERVVSVTKEISSEKLLIAYHTPSSNHPDYPALEIAHAVLFDGRSSRLQKILVNEHELASSAGGWVNQTIDPGLYIMDITMNPGKSLEDGLKHIDEQIEKMRTSPVELVELEKAKNRIETSFWSHFKTVDEKAESLGFHEIVAGDYTHFFQEVPTLLKVTAEDVMRVCQKYYTKENRTLIKAYPKQPTGEV
jgi:zinc protease